MNNLVIVLIVIPFLGSFVCLLSRYFLRLNIAEITSLGTICFCVTFLGILFPVVWEGKIILYPVGGWAEPLGISLYLDGLAWITSLIGMFIALLCLIFAWAEGRHEYKFYFFFLILLGGMEGVILTGDVFNMFVFFEIVSLATYILIAYSQKKKSIMASLNYLLISGLGMGFFLLGVALLYQHTGVLSFREIARLTTEIGRGSPVLTLSLISLVIGIGVKAAFIPLHTWLPDAHAYAPHSVSAVLSGVMIKISFLAIWRILRLLDTYYVQQIFVWIGGVTAFLAVIWAIAESDSKKLLAYSSISQMGFIIASFGVATALSLTASFYHILSHSLFKSLLFLTVGVVIYATGKRKIDEMAGLGKKTPLVGACFLIGALSISGIPPFNGYVSKSYIAASLERQRIPYALIFLASVGTVTSFIRLSRIFRTKEVKENFVGDRHPISVPTTGLGKTVPRGMLIPLIVLAVLCLLTGIFYPLIGGVISTFLLGERVIFSLPIYSLSWMADSLLIVGLGVAVYLLTISSKGKKALKYIRDLRLGLNNSLLLIVVGFLFFLALSWTMGGKFP